MSVVPLSDDFKARAINNRIKHYQLFVSSINQQRRLICDLDLDIVYSIPRDERCTFTVRNGKMHVKFHLCYRDETNCSDVQTLLGATVDDSDGSNFNNLAMPTIYSVSLNLIGTYYTASGDGDEPHIIPTTILQCVILSSHHVTNICIKGKFSGYQQTLYRFNSPSFNTLNNDSYIVTPTRHKSFMENPTSTVNHLTQSTLERFDVSPPALLDIIGTSLYNIQQLNIKNYIYYRPNDRQEGIGSIELDFFRIHHLSQFELDVNQIGLDHYQSAFFKITFIGNNSNNEEKEETKYYKCDMKTPQRILSLTPTTWKYIDSYKRFESPHMLLISIRFSKIDYFSVYHPVSPYKRYHQHVPYSRASVSISNSQAPEAQVSASSSSAPATN